MSLPDLEPAREAIAACRHRPGGLCVLTGAGMSAESGIPTFRDALTGYWARFDPAELASVAGFRADPARVWRWYAERREGVRGAQPNAGHRALAAFEARYPGALVLVTQNVDDLHQRAGHAAVLRLHGDILEERWLGPCERRRAGAGLARHPAQAERGDPPRPARPVATRAAGVAWFGESLPVAVLARAEQAAADCVVMLVVGTSGAVWPAAGLAEQAARHGAQVVIVNPAPSEIDDQARWLLRGTAAEVLPRLLEAP